MTTEQDRPWPDDATLAELVATARPRGGDAYADLLAANRELQDTLAGAAVPVDQIAEVTSSIEALTAVLRRHQVRESERVDGWRLDLPGRGHPLLPPFVVDDESAMAMRGHVTFTRFYLGGNGAAHGGAIPLLFDDVLGKVVNFNHRNGVARTAYLTANYRSIARVGELLFFDATVDRIDGRKIWASARLVTEGAVPVADCDGLFVRLRPGQP